MGTIVPHLLFALERYDRPKQSTRSLGGVIIAMETPTYIGRLMVGSDDVEDKSDLVIAGKVTSDLWRDLQVIGEYPGREVTRDLEEMWALFTDPLMTDGGTRVAFIRSGRYTSFVRRTDRYERILREFVSELGSRERTEQRG